MTIIKYEAAVDASYASTRVMPNDSSFPMDLHNRLWSRPKLLTRGDWSKQLIFSMQKLNDVSLPKCEFVKTLILTSGPHQISTMGLERVDRRERSG